MFKNATTEELRGKLRDLLASIEDLDWDSIARIQNHLDNLTKPQGSLGQLEEIAKKLGGIQRTDNPEIKEKAILLMAGDHGVVEEGVSAFPQEVTPQMLYNFLNGGAAINVLSRLAAAKVICTDVGIAFPLEPEDLMRFRIANGTKNMAKGPAMSYKEALQSILTGSAVAAEAIRGGVNLLATGDMGIGNTTPSSAIVHLYSGTKLSEVVGRGTGIDDKGLIRKQEVIARAIEINKPNLDDPIDVLSKVGGLEIGAITGSILQAAASRVPIIIDGFISTSAALLAAKLNPLTISYMIPSHSSVEPGHLAALKTLNFNPLLNLNMRLGEGTGAALTITLVEASIKILKEMATFSSAGVSSK